MESRIMTLGSLFDGSGGFPLGGILAGIEPVWSAEIEPFPVLVTHKRLPKVKHYGDVSNIKGSELEPVDIITFGSPCQDMSIAGRRAGLDGERSGLFYQAIRIIKEMREAKARRALRILQKNSQLVEETMERILENIRMDAREFYIEMEECYDSGDFARLNEMDKKLTELTEKEDEIRRAFSPRNPWIRHYADFSWDNKNAMNKAVEQITVRGCITDDKWLKNPTYPMDVSYSKGMKRARIDDETVEAKFCKSGRVSTRLPLYREPEMDVFIEGAVPKHVAFRDLLPAQWLSEDPHPSRVQKG